MSTVSLLFFAAAREAVGATEARGVLLAASFSCGADLVAAVVTLYPALAPLASSCMLAVDEEYVDLAGTPVTLRPGAVIALIPPLSGG